MKYVVDVEWSSHDALREGVLCLGWHRVAVSANDENEACLVAAQMVAATQGEMPTRTLLLV